MDAGCQQTLVWEWRHNSLSYVAAMCVQLVDASDNLAIHMLTRILLRSSSTHEPSDPPLGVVYCLLGDSTLPMPSTPIWFE